LASIRAKSADARILVATESVFSMDGDICPLRGIVELTEEFNAVLLLDEAHGFGVLGEHGMGLAEQEGLQARIAFQMGTLSKAAGLSGGYITASRDWIDLITNRARSFIYSTAPPPALAHAAITSLELIRSNEGATLRQQLQQHIAMIRPQSTPILPILLGSNEAALSASAKLLQQGFLIPAIRYPTVPRGTARLRISISAAHTGDAIRSLATTLDTNEIG
jgi:7-keto-8-aminopelargonate synthetase-like enzyme